MAGRVLRSSNGRFAGSTRGFGKGRVGQGGGYGNGRKAKVKKLRSAEQTRTLVRRGVSIGVTLGSAAGGIGLIRSGVKSGNSSLIAAGAALNLVARAGVAYGGVSASRKVISTGRRRG